MLNRIQHIRRVLLIVLGLNLLVALAKLIVGWLTASVSMQADGLHSLVDGSANLVGLAGIWLAGRPPDANHPYGHRKFETLASIAIGALLLYTAAEIVRNAVEQLTGGGRPMVTVTSFAVMVVTILINLGVTLWESRVGRRLGSDVLLADAAQTRSDIYASLAVVGSLIATQLGYYQLDGLVALVVAGLVGHAAWQVLRQAAAVLSDQAALPIAELDALIRQVPGVQGTHRVWTRGHAHEIYIDLDIKVAADLTVEEGHQLAHSVRDRIQARWPSVRHIMVHVEPIVPPDLTTLQQVYHLARQRHLNVHDVRVRAIDDGEVVAFHLEVEPQMTLGEAHRLADELEASIQADRPRVRTVTTHIEGIAGEVERHEDVTLARPDLVAQVETIANQAAGTGHCHAVRVLRHRYDGQITFDLLLHCTLPAALSTARAHEQAEQVELALRQALPNLGAVTVHPEPSE